MAKVIIQDVRCSYVYIKEPRKSEDGKDPKYSLQIIIPKNDPQLPKIKAAIKAAAQEKHGDSVKMTMLKLPLRDGDTDREGEEYEGHLFINANSARKPGIVNRNNEPADQDDMEEYCYSGAYFHASVNFYGYNFEGKKGVAAGLNNIMLRKKGDRLDGTASATSEFGEFAEAGTTDSADDGW
tara:strand:- start:39767 stop:40312 length:546 start_codon:yes stop_codon:yes gene_type:complete